MIQRCIFLLCGWMVMSPCFAQTSILDGAQTDSYRPEPFYSEKGHFNGNGASTDLFLDGSLYASSGDADSYQAATRQALQRCYRHHNVCQVVDVDQSISTRHKDGVAVGNAFGYRVEIPYSADLVKERVHAFAVAITDAHYSSSAPCNNLVSLRYAKALGSAAVNQEPLGATLGSLIIDPVPLEGAQVRVRNLHDGNCEVYVVKNFD